MDRRRAGGAPALLRRVRWGNVGRLVALLAAGALLATGGRGCRPENPAPVREEPSPVEPPAAKRTPSEGRPSPGDGHRAGEGGVKEADRRPDARRPRRRVVTKRRRRSSGAEKVGMGEVQADPLEPEAREPVERPRVERPSADRPAPARAPPRPAPEPRPAAIRLSLPAPAERRVHPRPSALTSPQLATGARPRRFASMSASWSSTQSPGSRAVTIRFSPCARQERSSADIVRAR